MKNKLAVITRLHYELDDPKFDKRLKIYKDYCLKSLLAQNDQNFDIWVWCEPHHDEIIKDIHPRINVFHAKWQRRKKDVYWIDYTNWKNIIGLPKYKTQVNLDSDDIFNKNSIAEIKRYCKGNVKKIVSMQPLKLDLTTKKLYTMRDYKAHRASPMFALYQPMEENYIFIQEYGHMNTGKYVDLNIKLPIGLSFMLIHGDNESTDLDIKKDKVSNYKSTWLENFIKEINE